MNRSTQSVDCIMIDETSVNADGAEMNMKDVFPSTATSMCNQAEGVDMLAETECDGVLEGKDIHQAE